MKNLMSIPQALGFLAETRQNLAAAESIIIPLKLKDPRLYQSIAPRISWLKRRQDQLERRVMQDAGAPQMGWIFAVALVGGMALTAIGGLILKHRAETGAERMRLETYNDCVKNLVDQKIPYENAVSRCQAAVMGVTDGGTDFLSIVKWVGIIGIGAASFWLLSKFMKK